MIQFNMRRGFLGLLAIGLLASCQKMRSVSTLFADLNIGVSEMPSNADPQVKLAKIRYKTTDSNNQIVAKTGIFLKTGRGTFEIACSDADKNRQLMLNLGFNADYAQFLRVDDEPDLVPTTVLACEQDRRPGKQKQYLFKYVQDGRIYNFVKDYRNNRVFLLGCQALVAGFGFAATEWVEAGAFAELLPASNDKTLLYAVSCNNGKKINPDPLGFSETTVAALAKLKTGLPSSDSVSIPLTLADTTLVGAPQIELTTATDKPCDSRLVWTQLIGPQNSILQVGSKPLVKAMPDCAVTLKATVDGNESIPLRVDIKIQPKKLQKVFADNGTFCMATDLGEIVCKGDRKETFPAVGSLPVSMIIDFNYICALYDPTKVQDNLRCKYASSVLPRLTALQPKGQVASIAGDQLFACGVFYDDKIEDKTQTLKCWRTSTIGESQPALLPTSVKMQGNTMLAASQDNGICWDSADVGTELRRISCYNDREFANLIPSGDPSKPTIKDMIALNLLNKLTDLQRGAQQAGGCVGYGEGKVKCWGRLEERAADKLKTVIIKPGTLHVNGSRICYQEKPGANPNLGVVQCIDGATGNLEPLPLSKTNLVDYAIFRKKDLTAIRCDLAGTDVVLNCSDGYLRQIGDLFPEGRYWSQFIAP